MVVLVSFINNKVFGHFLFYIDILCKFGGKN